jgi:hypothetical protein
VEHRTLTARAPSTLVVLLSLVCATGLSGQEDPRTPTPDTTPPSALPDRLDSAPDTLPGDALLEDTLSVRARALRRLRAMVIDPVEVDPEPSDSAVADTTGVAEPAEGQLAAGQEPAPGEERAPGDVPAPAEEPAPAEPPAAGEEPAPTEEPAPGEEPAPAAERPATEEPAAPGEEPAPAPTAPPIGEEVAGEEAAGEKAAGEEVVAEEVPGRGVPPERRVGEPPPAPTRRAGVAVDDTLVLFNEPGPDRLMREDSVLAQLRALEGYAVTEYRGESAVFEVEGDRLVLTGESRVEREGSSLETDSLLVYAGETGVVCGYGAPVLSGQTEPVESERVCFDIERELGVAVGARTQFQQQATWYVRGAENQVYLLTAGDRATLYGEGTEFTSCELDHPHYTFRAESVKMVEEGTMVARNITLRFADVPVFWLPWMVQSMKRGRRSGLLMPEFGVNDIVRNSSGYNRHLSNLGFYWAINDYMSAKGTFEWYSDNWTAVEGALTYRWLRQFLRGSLTAKRYWRQRDGEIVSKEFTLNTSNSWQPDERTRVQLNANFATSHDFVRDYSFDPRELNRRITSSASVNRSFSWGSVSIGADRSEQLSTGQVDLELPGLSLNISPITLLEVGEGRGLSWSGSGSFNNRTRTGPAEFDIRDQETMTASYSHRFNLGSLGLSQRVNWSDDFRGALPADTAGQGAVEEEASERLGWNTSLSYQQALWPGTTVSPSLTVTGNQLRDERTGGAYVAEPTRISAGASLNTALYGFWPGFGNFSRIRHKIAPSLRWSYSPAPEVTELQQEIFGTNPATLREQNQLSLSFNQTFEAKVREPEPEPGDTAKGGTAGRGAAGGAGTGAGALGSQAEEPEPGAPGEPRRLPQAEKVMLLALDTRTSFVYDFVAASEEGRGFQTKSISNSIRSDLLRGFQLTATHDLFEGDEGVISDTTTRTFAPALTNLTASFSIDHEFWLFRVLGLAGGGDGPAGPGRGAEPPPEGAEGVAGSDDPRVGAEADPDQGAGSSLVSNRGNTAEGPRAGVRGWRASLNYTLQRSRPGQSGTSESQLLSGNLSFEPTEKWSVRWSTAYSFTDGEFANHVLTLSRDLHRWQANFDFIKAQNGNFAMQFRVQLRDNPDLKLDYDQRSGPSERLSPRGGFR